MKTPAIQRTAPDCIQIRGARQHNLKSIDLDLPLGRLVVVTGPSGSGKSSLAFDTIYAEGQRRYVETFSPYTRQFLERMDKPDVDEILGIPPAIAIEQSNNVKTTRSTVGTITEINDYLKLLFPRVARAFCPDCAREIRPETPRSVVADTLAAHAGKQRIVAFPVPVPPSTKPADFFEFLAQQSYLRVWMKGAALRTDEPTRIKSLPSEVLVIQDRMKIERSARGRLTEALEAALRLGKDRIVLIDPDEGTEYPHSGGWHCAHCNTDIRPPVPGLFSFNHPLGACPDCRGFGRAIGIDLDRALPNKRMTLRGGVVKPFQTGASAECQRDLMRAADSRGIDVDTPFDDLPESDRHWVLYGEGSVDTSGEELWAGGRWYGVKGFFDWLESKTYKMHVRVLLSRYRSYTKCPVCDGGRYQPETLNFRLPAKKGKGLTLPELNALPASRLHELVLEPMGDPEDSNTSMLRREVAARAGYLVDVGLGYLTMDRATRTLSGGEVERVNLTSCLGASLVNSLFVLDEPSIGLHPRDIGRLVRVMQDLRDKGNTLLVVEHEEAVIRAADHLLDLGPGRGEEGGHLVFAGSPGDLETRGGSLTADYLSGKKSIPVPAKRRKPRQWLKVRGASENNLQNIDVAIPLGVFSCVTGVSGSGKSTLVHDVIGANLLRRQGEMLERVTGKCRAIEGLEHIGRVVLVDQSALSRTPRSTPAVYIGVFDKIRDLFADLPESRAAGLTPGTFSFNSSGGRCERCGGTGFEKVEMQFLSDLYVRCPECEGRRYQPFVLRIKDRDHSIHDVLEMTVSAAIRFFGDHPAIATPLRVLEEVGLGYLRLGQPLNTLSGGESQRLKLVAHLGGGKIKPSRNQDFDAEGDDDPFAEFAEPGHTLLIFDEPTTGLHFDDIAVLLKVFHRLVDEGNTLLVIEHNMEVIKCADHILDLGPEAGDGGGLLVAKGTPEQVAATDTHTGAYLARALGGGDSVLLPARTPSVRDEAPRPAITPGIRVTGAREHNLKNISLTIPRDELVIVTGLSGSGKSTLAFDILFAEGQRRFLDSMSPYARQFVEQLEKPDVDLIEGLPPTVAIEQRVTRGGGKSTVATVTEVYHFLRLLFAKTGVQHSPATGKPVVKQSLSAIVAQVETLAKKGRVRILAPLVRGRKGFHTDIAKWAEKKGIETLLVDGALIPTAGFQKLERFKEHTIDAVLGETGPGIKAQVEPVIRRAVDMGKGTAHILDHRNHIIVASTEMFCPESGMAFETPEPRLFSFNSPHGWCATCRGFGEVWDSPDTLQGDTAIEQELHEERLHENLGEGESRVCAECGGLRLNEVARFVRVCGLPLADFVRSSVREMAPLLQELRFHDNEKTVAAAIIPEILQRLAFMEKVGLGYLRLDRSAKTLSGGESQRIRLAAQLGSNLRGVLYVLDEPTIGLHPRDNNALLDTLDALKSRGNSLLVVEHDDETMRRADRIIDLGPGAGIHGGELVACGTLEEIMHNPASATGRCLLSPAVHPMRGHRRPLEDVDWVELKGACANNLKGIDVRFPVGRLIVLTGISGSGKSSLMRGSLLPALKHSRKGPRLTAAWHSITGGEHFETVYEVDQSPIGKTSRSTPATYIKVLDEIRKLYAGLPLARMRGFDAGRFSFNNESGRCETCQGQGVIKLEMSFLPPSYIPCEDCAGRRYNAQTLEVLYNERSVGDVMDMSIEQAAGFFAAVPSVQRPLSLLVETGLGYLKLGQPSPTLSGGEAQRLKLVAELRRGAGRTATAKMRGVRSSKSTLYLLEEPTIGLHMADVHRLLDVLHRLVDEGNTVMVIEHNLHLIAEADYILDIGPEAGGEGGELVVCGTPEEVARHRISRIAPFLRDTLARPASRKKSSGRDARNG